MSRKLAFLSLIGFLLCGVFLGLARTIGGDEIFHDPHSLEGLRPLIDMATRKEWRWAGGDTLAMDAPMKLRYQPQGAPGVAVTGTDDAVKHVQFRKGRIGSDEAAPKGLKAVVSGVTIRKFIVNSQEALELGHIDQPDLEIFINGGGSVHGDGRVSRLKLVMAGHGNADLGNLSVGDADISLLGSGSATLSPHGAVTVLAAGSGQLRLLTKPASLSRRVLGSAEIITAQSAPPLPPDRPMRVEVPVPMPMEMPVPLQEQSNGTSGSGENVIVNDNQDVDLGHVDQRKLVVTIAASGSVKAEGRVDELTVHAMGSGQARLGRLTARKVTVMLAGDGNVTIAPGQEARITILGSGNVHLQTNTAEISSNIVGSGRIISKSK